MKTAATKTASLSALALLLAATATPAAAGVLLFDGSKVTGITGLDVAGAAYDVAFRSGTFTSVFGSALDFTTSDAADLAIAQVNLALNPSSGPAPFLAVTDADNVDAAGKSYYVPFATTVRSRSAIYAANIYQSLGDTTVLSPDTSVVWADFTVVPLPGAALLLGTALAGLWGVRRRQHGGAAASA